nr:hypothetical protein [Mycobacterium szulgai]
MDAVAGGLDAGGQGDFGVDDLGVGGVVTQPVQSGERTAVMQAMVGQLGIEAVVIDRGPGRGGR